MSLENLRAYLRGASKLKFHMLLPLTLSDAQGPIWVERNLSLLRGAVYAFQMNLIEEFASAICAWR
jgi:hypothetical protein